MKQNQTIALLVLLQFATSCTQMAPVTTSAQNSNQNQSSQQDPSDDSTQEKNADLNSDKNEQASNELPMDEFQADEILKSDPKDVPSEKAIEAALFFNTKISIEKAQLQSLKESFDPAKAEYDFDRDVYWFKTIPSVAAIMGMISSIGYVGKHAERIFFLDQGKLIEKEVAAQAEKIAAGYRTHVNRMVELVKNAAPSQNLLRTFETQKENAIKKVGQNNKAIQEAIEKVTQEQIKARKALQARYARELEELMTGSRTQGKFGRHFGKLFDELKNKVRTNFGVKLASHAEIMKDVNSSALKAAKERAEILTTKRNRTWIALGALTVAAVAGTIYLYSSQDEDSFQLEIKKSALDALMDRINEAESTLDQSEKKLLELMSKHYNITFTDLLEHQQLLDSDLH